jgi:NAD(P)H-hydrate epimerase
MASFDFDNSKPSLKGVTWRNRDPITSEDVSILDENSEYLGVQTACLMENAGKEVANFVVLKLGNHVEGKRVSVFAGTGNNGGDGFVAARHLANLGAVVNTVILGSPREIRTSEAAQNYRALERMVFSVKKYVVRDSSELNALQKIVREADVIIDAIFGTGVKGRIREPAATAIAMINSSKALKIAVDIPSGVNPDTGEISDTAVLANATVTFHRVKGGLLKCPENTGEIAVRDIGIPLEAELVVGPGDVRAIVKPRLKQYHKGEYGKVLIIGGSNQYSGAPCFSALAALKTGAGLAIIGAPSSVADIIRGFSPDLIVRDLKGKVLSLDSIPVIEELLDWSSSVVIGPGLGLSEETEKAFTEILKTISRKRIPTVVDADGLKLVVKNESFLKEMDVVLTPHLGEFKILTGAEIQSIDDLDGVLRTTLREAKRLGATVLLKVANGLAAISDGKKTKINFTGNAGMAKGGVGDVLSGMAGTFMSWTKSPFSAAAAAAFVCGKAGDIAYSKVGASLTPTDLINSIPEAMNEFYTKKRQE